MFIRIHRSDVLSDGLFVQIDHDRNHTAAALDNVAVLDNAVVFDSVAVPGLVGERSTTASSCNDDC